MKIQVFPCIIAVVASILIAFGLYSWCRCEDMRLLVTILGGISLLLTGGATLAISMPQKRTTINVKVASGLFTLLLVISNVVFCAVTTFSIILYVFINGLLLLVWLMSLYAITKTL